MMRLPASFASPEELCAALVEFIVAFKWLCVLRANDALLLGFDWPTDWTLLYQDDTVFNSDHWIDLVKDGLSHHSWPDSLKDFIHQCNTLKLPRKVIPSDFGTILQDIETSSCSLDQSSSGMNRKKLHEVERFSRVIIDFVTKAGISDTATIVDVGAGQGYLTHRLSTEYPCVAVDFDQIQTRYDSLNLSCQNYDKFSRQEIESNLNNHAMLSLLDSLFDYYHVDPIAKTFVTVDDDDSRYRIWGYLDLLSHAQIQEFMQLPVTKNAKLKIYATHCIKSLMSRVLESLVLMDRFMALDEMNRPKGFSDIGTRRITVKMLNLFDVAESPRNVVFLAEKQKVRA
ncbi:hypothetical protein BDR26DRAFT_936696 [Obelidium mucronatum]|nr:hypothetical protein BDR26DRAFT_936696 [Obelidium mucronatum]